MAETNALSFLMSDGLFDLAPGLWRPEIAHDGRVSAYRQKWFDIFVSPASKGQPVSFDDQIKQFYSPEREIGL